MGAADVPGHFTKHDLTFPSLEAMEQLAAMGMEEGLTQAVGQIDAILAEDTAGHGANPTR